MLEDESFPHLPLTEIGKIGKLENWKKKKFKCYFMLKNIIKIKRINMLSYVWQNVYFYASYKCRLKIKKKSIMYFNCIVLKTDFRLPIPTESI